MKAAHWYAAFFMTALFAFHAIILASQSNAADNALIPGSDVQRKLDAIRIARGYPGMTFAVYGRGLDGRFASGLADRESHTAMNPDALMLGASTGKTYVAAMITRLVDRGRLSYSDKAAHFFDPKSAYHLLPGASTFTIAMLMNQTTGLVDATVEIEANKSPDSTWSDERRFRSAIGTKLLFEPGTRVAYSDLNYQILGSIIGNLHGGEPFGKLVERTLLRPYGIRRTKAIASRVIPGLIAGYAGPTDKPQDENLTLPDKVTINGRTYMDPRYEAGGGGFATDSPDLARWMYALFNSDVVSSAGRSHLLRPSRPFEEFNGPGTRYGSGLFIFRTALGTAYGHGGWDPGYRIEMLYFPKLCVGAAVQVNSQIDRTGTFIGAELLQQLVVLTEAAVIHTGRGRCRS